jgi:hypothetical protein
MKLEGNGWIKAASVTTGGKSYFWFRKTSKALQWIVWDRKLEQWICQFERRLK